MQIFARPPAMSSEDFTFDPARFSGIVRLFPLPGVVLFPQVIQPLHIFEERYRRLLDEALADDRLIAMTVLQPGWEADYEGRPPVHEVACLGRVISHQRLPDGRSNLRLMGLARVRLTRELPPDALFRRAEAAVLEDVYAPAGKAARAALKRRLLAAFQAVLARTAQPHKQLDERLAGEMLLGTLTDIAAYTLDLDPDLKVRLLAETDVDRRAALFLAHLEQHPPSPQRPFPPDFSTN